MLKRLHQVGGGKVFNVLYTIFNEQHLIRAQWLASGKTLELMEEGLLNIVKSLRQHGLPQPALFYTDALNQDRAFLERTLGSLTEGVAHVDADAHGLPVVSLPAGCELRVVETDAEINAEVDWYGALADGHRRSTGASAAPLALGFDMEWNVEPGPTDEISGAQGRTACMQLASEQRVTIFRVHRRSIQRR